MEFKFTFGLTRLDGILVRSLSMGVSGAVVSAIASTILQYERSRFLAMNAKSSATCNQSTRLFLAKKTSQNSQNPSE